MLVFCSVMVLRQFKINHQRHNELREAFILLQSKGYTNQADRLYYRLLVEVERARKFWVSAFPVHRRRYDDISK